MEAGLDRRVARLLFAGLALVVLGTTALTESPPIAVTERPDDPYAFAAVVVRARTADTVSHSTTWLVERTDGDRRDAEIVELARTPAASVEVSTTAVTVHRGDRQWSCTDVADDFECLEVVAPPGPTIGSAGLFVTAAASGAYRFERRPDRRVAGGPAECFGVVLVGIEPVPGIGRETEACFAVGGPLVRIARTYSGVVEVQTAQQWARVDAAEVERRIATATRGALV